MASTNPVSPKVIAGGIGAVLIPFLIAGLAAVVDFLTGDSGQPLLEAIPTFWRSVILVALAALGSLLAGYRQTDPLRVPTVNEEALNEINE